MASGAALTLQNGVLNDYISRKTTLVLNSTSILDLNFSGADIIGGLSLDGGATWLPNGTYTAAQLVTLGLPACTGIGSLTVGTKIIRLISITSP